MERVARYLTIIIILFTNVGICYAILPAPPVIKDVQTQQYFKELYDNHNVLVSTSTAPNGTRNGASGEIILFNNSGVLQLWINGGGKVWTKL